MFTKKEKECLQFSAKKQAHNHSKDDMFLWSVKSRDTALAKSVNGKLSKRKWNTYIHLGDGIRDAEWGTSSLLYLYGGVYCMKMPVRLFMYDGTQKIFNVFYNFHHAHVVQ